MERFVKIYLFWNIRTDNVPLVRIGVPYIEGIEETAAVVLPSVARVGRAPISECDPIFCGTSWRQTPLVLLASVRPILARWFSGALASS
jgi:hypothetical protein